MEFFLDTADVDEIREIASWGILDGVTTNPSLIKKSGRDFKQVVGEIALLNQYNVIEFFDDDINKIKKYPFKICGDIDQLKKNSKSRIIL